MAEQRTPFQGLKVIDITHAWAGPVCAMLLGDMGADVVKVEPLTGDQFRVLDKGWPFLNLNRNKRGIALNLKRKEGREIVLRLLRGADVLVENYLPGSMERLGMSYQDISQFNPGIIYCSISGFGQEGPLREHPAYDPILQAMSGIMLATGEPDRPPVRILPATIDYCAGVNAAFGIVTSIINRQKTGKGQRIDVALLDIALNQMSHYVTKYAMTGELPERMGSGHPGAVPYEVFPARDGLVLIACITDQMWQNLCKALGLEDLGKNPHYAGAQGRLANRRELVETLRKITQQYGSRELESKLFAEDVPCAKLRTVEEIMREPHVQSRQILETLDYPPVGKLTTVKNPLFFSGQSPATRRPPPVLGEHTTEVLRELEYSEERINELINTNVVLQGKK